MTKRFGGEFWLRLLLIGLFIFALISNVKVAIRGHALSQALTAAKAETALGQYNNDRLKLLLAYYQTPSYQEVEARRRLQLKKPDETVYAVKGLPAPGDTSQPATLSDTLYADVKPVPPAPKTNIQLWWGYFFN